MLMRHWRRVGHRILIKLMLMLIDDDDDGLGFIIFYIAFFSSPDFFQINYTVQTHQ